MSHPNQQQQQQNPYNRNQNTGNVPVPNAWQQPPQAAAAAGGYGMPPQQQRGMQPQQPQQQQQMPPQAGGYGMPPYGMNPYYMAQQQAAAAQQQRPPSMWQPAPPQYAPVQGGTAYYPPPPPQQQQQQQQPPPQVAPPKKRALVITDKDGNPIDLTSSKTSAAKTTSMTPASTATTASTTTTTTKPPASVTPPPTSDGSDVGAKMKQLAMERIAAMEKEEASSAAAASDEAKKKQQEEKSKKEAQEKSKREAEEKAKKEAEEEKAKQEAEEKAKKEAEEKAKREAEEKAKREAEEAEKVKQQTQQEPPKRPSFLAKLQAKKEAAGISRGSSLSALQAKLDAKEEGADNTTAPPPSAPTAKSPLRPGGMTPRPPAAAVHPATTSATMSSSPTNTTKRRVYTKMELLRFKQMDVCCCRPADLPDMTVERIIPVGGGGGRRGDRRESSWQRGAAPPRDSQRRMSTQQEPPKQQQQWARGVAPPPPPPPDKRNRGGRNDQGPPLLDGPVAPLVKSENRWRPKKDTNALVVAEKQVKAILNKMTKEKFDKLSTQMCEIPILSYDMLTMMIHNVYEKAIDEPTFGDMYADLCAKLSQMASQQGTTTFIQIIPSDEEPPTDGEATTGESSSHKVYRWSNDVSTTDAEIVGPYASADECTEVALSGEDVEPTQRPDDLKLELVSLNIAKGTFIKVMKKKDEDNAYYVVYFPVAEHDDCGQQLSKIFLSERECMSDAVKQNSFKRSLLNKCQDEFDKQDIYVGWKEEKKAYEETKSSLTEAERNEKEGELDFRRIRIKKQMLGNIKFIGQLYKKGLLKEKIMRYCIGSLLKLEVIDDAAKYPEYRDTGDMDLDEEDHEAACSMFATIGKTIDKPHAKAFMHVCFSKMEKLSNDKSLNSRSRFMYKDLIDMRKNRWEPRRKTEKAKTIDEIRKDFEREERRQEQQSRMGGGGHRGGNRGDRRDFNDRRDSRRDFGRSRQPKPQQTDDDGFTTVAKGAGKRMSAAPIRIATRPQSVKAVPAPKSPSKQAPRRAEPEPVKKDGPAPLDPKKLERRIATIRNEYIQDPANVEELLLSFDELTGTPDYGTMLVSVNADRLIDAKDAEREAILDMLVLLADKDRLSKEHVETGLEEFVECVDMVVMDLPKVYEYVADMLSALLKAEALDVAWLCERAQKIKDDEANTPGAHEKLIRKTMEAMKRKYGADAVQSSFADNDSSLKLAGLLGADKWNEMASEILS